MSSIEELYKISKGLGKQPPLVVDGRGSTRFNGVEITGSQINRLQSVVNKKPGIWRKAKYISSELDIDHSGTVLMLSHIVTESDLESLKESER